MLSNHIHLDSSRLGVDIALPGTLYKGCRFDHSANISQITFDGKHTFCGMEQTDPSCMHGFGLLNEFDPEYPPAYNKVSAGDDFLKVGVGRLQRESNEDYDFFHPYPFEPAEITIRDLSLHSVRFELKSPRVSKVQYLLNKTISVIEDTLTINYSLTNLGSSRLKVTEYCHNFLSIDERRVDDSYQLTFDTQVDTSTFKELVNPGNAMQIKGSEITWRSTPNSDFFIAAVNETNKFCQSWSLTNSKSGVGIKETLDHACNKVNLWGAGHVISPELFVETQLNTKEEIQWNREYQFFKS